MVLCTVRATIKARRLLGRLIILVGARIALTAYRTGIVSRKLVLFETVNKKGVYAIT